MILIDRSAAREIKIIFPSGVNQWEGVGDHITWISPMGEGHELFSWGRRQSKHVIVTKNEIDL